MTTLTKSKKTEGWRQRLINNLVICENLPFIWGENDCVSFTSDNIRLMTGKDPSWWNRGKYSNKFGALRVLKEFNGLGLVETFEHVFLESGYERTDKLEIGDVGFMEVENLDTEAAQMFGGVTLATGLNSGYAVAPGKDSLVRIMKYNVL